jgi:hypothetical protein
VTDGERRRLPPHRLPIETPPRELGYSGDYSEMPCAQCGKPFWCRGGDEADYCSAACKAKARLVRHLAKRQARARELTPVTCAGCDGPLAAVAQRVTRRYCSDACKQRFYRRLKPTGRLPRPYDR